MKKNQNNEMVKLKNQIMNISNMVNQIQLKNNEFKFLKEQINSIENKINLLSMPFQGSISNNQLPFNPINMTLNNNNPNEEQNIMKIAEKKNSLNNSYYEECYNRAITVYFRESGSNKKGPPIAVQCLPDDKICDVIERYRVKANNHKIDIKFIFNAKKLNKDITICENGIMNNSSIFVVQIKK